MHCLATPAPPERGLEFVRPEAGRAFAVARLSGHRPEHQPEHQPGHRQGPLSERSLPSSLSDALRGLVPPGGGQGPGPDLAGPPPGLELGDCRIGRIDILEAAGGRLSLATAGEAETPRVGALIQLTGSVQARQGERAAALGAGDLCLIRGARPLELRSQGPFRFVVVKAPEQEFAERFPLWRAAMLTPIPGGRGVPAVFRDAVTSLNRWCESFGRAGSECLANAVIDLMGALVACSVPANPDCVTLSMQQKDRIKEVVRLNLRNPDLDVDLIAAKVGLSARQIHRLLADEGTTLMRWVWTQRLEQCHRELRQPESARRSISDIAYTWGFNDQAHFSRAFRKHFGVSPRDARRAAGVVTATAAA